MKVQIYGKNITVTPAIAEKVENKLKVLEKYFIIDSDTMANVVVRTYPQGQKIEVTIPMKGIKSSLNVGVAFGILMQGWINYLS